MAFRFLKLELVFALVAALSHAQAPREICRPRLAALAPGQESTVVLRAADNVDGIVQLELTSNGRQFRESTKPKLIDFVLAPADQAYVLHTADASKELRDFFVRGGKVLFPRHLYNQSQAIPFAGETPAGKMAVQLTASRSMVFRLANGQVYSVKVPTDHPHRQTFQPTKLEMADDAGYSVETTRLIDRLDAQLGKDPELLILRDVLTVQDRKDWNGLVVRDLTPLTNPNFRYVPAFTLPYSGQRHVPKGENFEEFWGKHFAEAVGRAKAKLLLRYGLQMATPNAQNILLELTKDGKPTGRVVFRDVVDSHYVEGVSDAILTEKDMQMGGVDQALQPFANNSVWQMDVAGPKRLDPSTTKSWVSRHDEAYFKTIEEALGTKLELGPQDDVLDYYGKIRFEKVTSFLQSPEGRAALQKYHQDLTKRSFGTTR